MPSARSFVPPVNLPHRGPAPVQRWYGFHFVLAAPFYRPAF